MAQLSKVFFPYDPLPAQDLNDIVGFMNGVADGSNLEEGAVSPNQRAGGFFMTTFTTSAAGTVNVSGCPFTPKFAQFFSNHGQNAQNNNWGRGAATGPSNQYAAWGASAGSSHSRNSYTNRCYAIGLGTSTTAVCEVSFVSFNTDGCTVNVNVPLNANVQVMFYG